MTDTYETLAHLRVAQLATQLALESVVAGTTGMNEKAQGQVTAALSGALMALDVAADFTYAAHAAQQARA